VTLVDVSVSLVVLVGQVCLVKGSDLASVGDIGKRREQLSSVPGKQFQA
jgi:hypothetical protein